MFQKRGGTWQERGGEKIEVGLGGGRGGGGGGGMTLKETVHLKIQALLYKMWLRSVCGTLTIFLSYCKLTVKKLGCNIFSRVNPFQESSFSKYFVARMKSKY